jgi:hypothetical protein
LFAYFDRSQKFARQTTSAQTITGPMSNLTQAPVSLQVHTNLDEAASRKTRTDSAWLAGNLVLLIEFGDGATNSPQRSEGAKGTLAMTSQALYWNGELQ